ncbi:MAG: class I SAM-dependent methyltransferase [Leptolyngbya sp. SIO4C1]|nr:class I SAM-dependent methyltransferase [Leptolyngbya sp. SIO4C1]
MPDTAAQSELAAYIADRIQSAPQQQIPFAEFMSLALYHPQQGYYASPASGIGPQGDFITSPHLGHDFGELLAEQLAEMWQILAQPQPFQLVEMGAGQGLIAADVLRHLQQNYSHCFAALKYAIVEQSAALRTEQQRRLEPWTGKVQWLALDAIAPDSITGCVFSNELVDALPVHLVEVRDGRLWEVYVGFDSARPNRDSDLVHFVERLGDLSTSRIRAYFELVGIDLLSDQYPEGYRTEVNLAALDWIDAIAARLTRGYLLTIDYGHTAQRYYSPMRHSGTLKCYYQHRHHDNPYLYVGKQDITAHVDFTALERQGNSAGLQRVSFTQQALFLMALGLGDRMAALSQAENSRSLQELLQRRAAMRQLIDPIGLGNFGVLLQSKHLSEAPLPRGFRLPV